MKKHLARPWARRGGLFLAAFSAASLALGVALWKQHGEPLVRFETAAPPFLAQLTPEAPWYFHDDIVSMTLRVGNEEIRETLLRSTAPLTAWVERDGIPVVTVGEMESVTLSYDSEKGVWRGRWPVPWNAPDGDYVLRLETAPMRGFLGPVDSGLFRVASRPFKAVPGGYSVLTLEGLGSLGRFPGPQGGEPHGGAMAEWAEFMGADAVLIQGAESSGYARKLDASFPWQMRSAGPVTALARECHRRGLTLGVYILAYMVGGPPAYSPDYEYGWHYQGGQAVNGLDLPVRRGVSIGDKARPGDIVKALNRWAEVDGVDFVGLDYIRPVFGGNELVDDFFRDMPGAEKPAGYDAWTPEKRMAWIARKRYLAPRDDQRNEYDYRTADQWFWYRAHRTAKVVREIAEGFGEKKPLWAFTLSWQKGWEHGQDPSMMRDAGIDRNGIMLYEADKAQFRGLVRQWKGYTGNAGFNLVVGNTFDWPLHQKSQNPAAPEEMYKRTLLAVEEFQEGKPMRGVFFHDLARGLRGRLGPYSPKEWFLAGGAAMTRVREIHGKTSYRFRLEAPNETKPRAAMTARLSVEGSDGPVSVELYASSDLEISTRTLVLSPAAGAADVSLRWVPNEKSVLRGARSFFAARSSRKDRPDERCQVHIHYIQGPTPAPEQNVAEADNAAPVPTPGEEGRP